MTGPLPPVRPLPVPTAPNVWPATAPAATITVPDLGCGHLPGERCDSACDYWRGVAAGDYPSPDAYKATGAVVVLPPHLPGLTPLTDPALRGVA